MEEGVGRDVLRFPASGLLADPGFMEGVVERLEPMAWKVAGATGGMRPHEKADLKQDIMSHVCVAAARYDSSKGFAFFAFAKACMRNRAMDISKRQRTYRRNIPAAALEHHLPACGGRAPLPGDDPPPYKEAREAAESMGLPERCIKVMDAYERDPWASRKEVAAMAGLPSAAAVGNALARIREARKASGRGGDGS